MLHTVGGAVAAPAVLHVVSRATVEQGPACRPHRPFSLHPGSPPRGPQTDGALLPQSSDDLSSRVDSRRNGSFDGYAGSREGSLTSAYGSGTFPHSFTYGQQHQSRSAGAVNPFQTHQAARNGMRGFGSSDNLAGLGLPGHQRAGESPSACPRPCYCPRDQAVSAVPAQSSCACSAAVTCQAAQSTHVKTLTSCRGPLIAVCGMRRTPLQRCTAPRPHDRRPGRHRRADGAPGAERQDALAGRWQRRLPVAPAEQRPGAAVGAGAQAGVERELRIVQVHDLAGDLPAHGVPLSFASGFAS